MYRMRHSWLLVGVVFLTACSDTAAPFDPGTAAGEECARMAVTQLELESAGETQVREIPSDEGDAFEVTGTSEGTEWICTWTMVRTAGGTEVVTTIDQR